MIAYGEDRANRDEQNLVHFAASNYLITNEFFRKSGIHKYIGEDIGLSTSK